MQNNLFGKYLKKRRKEKNFTLKYLAEKIGLTHGYLSNVENGKMRGNLDLIEGIAIFLDIPILDSIMRLKIDQGELEKFEKKLQNSELNIIESSDIFGDLFFEKPGKYYLVTRRLLSLKTLNEISQETGINVSKITFIEESGPLKEEDVIQLGICYGIDNFIDYLLESTGAEYFFKDVSTKHRSKFFEIKTLWNPKNNIELSADEVKVKEEYEKKLIENYIKNNAKFNVQKQTEDIYFILDKLETVYFNGKPLSNKKKNIAKRILEVLIEEE